MLEVQGLDSPDKQGFDRGKPLSLVPEAGKDGTTTAETAPRKAGLFLSGLERPKAGKAKPLSLVPEAGKDGTRTTTAEMAPRKAGLFL